MSFDQTVNVNGSDENRQITLFRQSFPIRGLLLSPPLPDRLCLPHLILDRNQGDWRVTGIARHVDQGLVAAGAVARRSVLVVIGNGGRQVCAHVAHKRHTFRSYEAVPNTRSVFVCQQQTLRHDLLLITTALAWASRSGSHGAECRSPELTNIETGRDRPNGWSLLLR